MTGQEWWWPLWSTGLHSVLMGAFPDLVDVRVWNPNGGPKFRITCTWLPGTPSSRHVELIDWLRRLPREAQWDVAMHNQGLPS